MAVSKTRCRDDSVQARLEKIAYHCEEVSEAPVLLTMTWKYTNVLFGLDYTSYRRRWICEKAMPIASATIEKATQEDRGTAISLGKSRDAY